MDKRTVTIISVFGFTLAVNATNHYYQDLSLFGLTYIILSIVAFDHHEKKASNEAITSSVAAANHVIFNKSPSKVQSDTVAAKIQQLNQLLEEGVLTKSEFEYKRQQIIDTWIAKNEQV